MKRTQGIETSKYLQEKKSKEIPVVAASELGIAQTRVFIFWGCGAPMWDCVKVAERHGKAGHRG
jgi:hypothetical protein